MKIFDKKGTEINIGSVVRVKIDFIYGGRTDATYRISSDWICGLSMEFIDLFGNDPKNQLWFDLSVKHKGLAVIFIDGLHRLVILERETTHQETYDIEVLESADEALKARDIK